MEARRNRPVSFSHDKLVLPLLKHPDRRVPASPRPQS
jgi:hypothetical protein